RIKHACKVVLCRFFFPLPPPPASALLALDRQHQRFLPRVSRHLHARRQAWPWFRELRLDDAIVQRAGIGLAGIHTDRLADLMIPTFVNAR
ncbi:MAG TPA: hypothetical protein VIW67_03295, partial [Terriglobales bacterium]